MNLKLITTLSLIAMTGVSTEALAKFRAGPLGDDGIQNVLKRPLQGAKKIEEKRNNRSSSSPTNTTTPKASDVGSGTRAPIHKPASRAHHIPKGISFPRAHAVPQGMKAPVNAHRARKGMKAPANVHGVRKGVRTPGNVHSSRPGVKAPGYVHGPRRGIYAPNRIAPKPSIGVRRGR